MRKPRRLKTTSVQLSPDELAWSQGIALQLDVSVSRVLREAVQDYLERRGYPVRRGRVLIPAEATEATA